MAGMRTLIINGEPRPEAIITAKTLDAPKPKTTYIQITGADGSLDLSSVLTDGNPVYDNRDISFEITFIGADFFAVQSAWNGLYHGREIKITTNDLTDRYLTGRCTLSGWKEGRGLVTMVLTVDADPFWYAAAETIVSGSASSEPGTPLILPNTRKWVAPVITPSQPMDIQLGSRRYQVQSGPQMIPGILLKEGNTSLSLIGSGMCEFRYRKGWL